MKNIILTGGGTAGHCIPHVALLPLLKKNFDNIYYIGSANGIERKIIEQHGIKFFSVDCGKLNRTFTLKNFTTPFKVIKGISQASKIIDNLKPNVIFSKGGYVAVPTVIAAHNKKIPIISHESDLSIGLANRITGNFCKKILTSFPETALKLKNGEYVGSPIREQLFSTNRQTALARLGLTGKKPILLVTGGSLGAQKINEIVRDSLSELTKKFEILHICGKNNLQKTKTPSGYHQKEFLDNMEDAFAVADVCISRAGANTVFELIALNIPTLLIPLPKKSSRGDQVENAEYFFKKGLVNMLNQDVLTKDSLILSTLSTYENSKNIKEKLKNFKYIAPNKKICKLILDYSKP